MYFVGGWSKPKNVQCMFVGGKDEIKAEKIVSQVSERLSRKNNFVGEPKNMFRRWAKSKPKKHVLGVESSHAKPRNTVFW
jgi:hypothetical protein